MFHWLIPCLLFALCLPARADDGDEAAVRAVFAGYKAAVLARNGDRAADRVRYHCCADLPRGGA